MIDVAAGDKIPRKNGPGITQSDILVINKTDLAPFVGASLEVMAADARRMRPDAERRPFVMSNLRTLAGVDEVVRFIERRGLRQISDAGAIESLVDQVIAANPSIVAEFRAGKEKAFNSLVGKAMAATKGKANPAQVNAILRRRLGA